MPGQLERVTETVFRHDPVGRYFAGDHFLYACVEGRLFARILWDQPTGQDAERMMEASEVEHREEAPFAGLFDAGAVRDVDWAGLGTLTSRLRARGVPPRMFAHALVAPPTEFGRVAADLYLRFQTPLRREVAATRAGALSWLGCAEMDRVLTVAEAEATAGGALLGRVRAALQSTPPEADLAVVARQLGVSGRTLQRRLGEQGSSFRTELARARVRVAERLLRDTQLSITEIAYEVGCSSPQSFSRLFRAERGAAPGDVRRQLNAGSAPAAGPRRG